MSRRRMLRPVVRTMVSAALFGAVGSFGAAAAAAVPSGQAGVNHLIAVRGDTADSLNWAGYAVTPGSGITAVSSTFTVPSAGELPPGFSASWAGIGGYTTSDLIQAGVSENSAIGGELLGGGQYNAWYEILPASETPITAAAAATFPAAPSTPETRSASTSPTPAATPGTSASATPATGPGRRR